MRSDPPYDAASAERAGLARLIERAAGGDRAAFRQLYSSTAPKLYGICLRILDDPAAAEEALQDSFMSVWRLAGTFDEGRGNATAWLVTIARSRAIDRYRATRRVEALPIDAANEVADTALDAERQLIAAGETGRLNDGLATLDSGDARLIRAAFYEGSSYAELATRAGLPLGTVKSRIRRALLKLRERLA